MSLTLLRILILLFAIEIVEIPNSTTPMIRARDVYGHSYFNAKISDTPMISKAVGTSSWTLNAVKSRDDSTPRFLSQQITYSTWAISVGLFSINQP